MIGTARIEVISSEISGLLFWEGVLKWKGSCIRVHCPDFGRIGFRNGLRAEIPSEYDLGGIELL